MTLTSLVLVLGQGVLASAVERCRQRDTTLAQPCAGAWVPSDRVWVLLSSHPSLPHRCHGGGSLAGCFVILKTSCEIVYCRWKIWITLCNSTACRKKPHRQVVEVVNFSPYLKMGETWGFLKQYNEHCAWLILHMGELSKLGGNISRQTPLRTGISISFFRDET